MSLRGFIRSTMGATPSQEVVARTDPTVPELAFQAQVTEFWTNISGSAAFSPRLIDRLWVANRCIHLNAQQLRSMPLRFQGTSEPAWVTNPDPVWYPNGIGDCIYALADDLYRWGDAFCYITSRYSNGYPSAWTVLCSEYMTVGVFNGRKTYRYHQTELNPDAVVQIYRDPRSGSLRGTSAISSYSSQAYGLMAASDLGRVMMAEGSVPNAVLQSKRKLSPEQAVALQTAWVNRTAVRRGAPAVLPPDVEFKELAFSPSDLLLLDAQKFDAQVIASAMGVPAMFINLPIEGGLTYQTPSMLGEHWWRFELRPSSQSITNALSAQMLPRGSYVWLDAHETLAPTFKDLVEIWVEMAKEGIVTVEEFRTAVLHLPPQEQVDALAALQTPPSAGASPADQPPSVVELRPTSSVSY